VPIPQHVRERIPTSAPSEASDTGLTLAPVAPARPFAHATAYPGQAMLWHLGPCATKGKWPFILVGVALATLVVLVLLG
jgi:hypothetical protein